MRIPGVAQSGLNDERLADVLNYMLQTFSKENLSADFQPYSGHEVSRYRRRVLLDPLKRRAEIVAAAQSDR
jgi:hypothetical protein